MAEIKFNTGWLTAIGLTAKCGTPEEVAAVEASYTGQYLKKML